MAEIGFLRKLEDSGRNFEIHNMVKGFITADAIEDMLQKLMAHAQEKNNTE